MNLNEICNKNIKDKRFKKMKNSFCGNSTVILRLLTLHPFMF